MTIINTTFAIERSIFEEFIGWLKGIYLEAAMNTGLFTSPRLARVLTDTDPETVSIACELQCDSLSEAQRWHDETAALLRSDMLRRWEGKALFFTTYLKML